MKPVPQNPFYSQPTYSRRGFTLIELLVVISIIGVLAALIIPLAGTVAIHKKISTAQAELQQIETALSNYKARYGIYPPSNSTNALLSPLYYELSGATNDGTYFNPLDGSAGVKLADYQKMYGVGGVVNCSKPGEDAVIAQDFLPGLRANRIVAYTNGTGSTFNYLVSSVSGLYPPYQPLLPLIGISANPFRYRYPGTNNPGSYDLWIQLAFATNNTVLICNWSGLVQHNVPLP